MITRKAKVMMRWNPGPAETENSSITGPTFEPRNVPVPWPGHWFQWPLTCLLVKAVVSSPLLLLWCSLFSSVNGAYDCQFGLLMTLLPFKMPPPPEPPRGWVHWGGKRRLLALGAFGFWAAVDDLGGEGGDCAVVLLSRLLLLTGTVIFPSSFSQDGNL